MITLPDRSDRISAVPFAEFQQLPFTIPYNEEKDQKQKYEDREENGREGSVHIRPDEYKRAYEDRDLDDTGKAGEDAKDEKDAAEDVGEGDIVAHEHGGEGAKGHPVVDEIEHGPHIHQEIHALITEKDTEEYSYGIEPLGMVGVTPMFHTLNEIHNGIVL